ncbi:lipase maturation factor family protein [Halogeometricum borinquense]|uniref:Lipase maturation factor family protein n=1 Tax=Halogeometricum borinquense TaxID=60847 RepID=A0A6C0UJQ6_9EURY|nr:lipase maturation factor family protein [Halogeometricum borinquense]QIB75764.1 lipase maturation factor family protein [Halogeometricum borinquense]
MVVWGQESYWLVRFLFQRGLAVIYVVAFLVAARQFRPLVGEDGLLPLGEFVERTSFVDRPSLFHVAPDDRVVGAAAWTGVVLALCAFVGVPYWFPESYAVAASMLLWATMWALYLSFVNAGQLFYGFGWESMLLETGFLAVFLGAGASGPPVIILWLLKWVLFRNLFGAGLIKMRGDDCWRELTCLDYHYETQPIPNPVSWYAHHLPDRFHRLEVLGNHIVELAVPFLYFAPQPYAAIGGGATIFFQLWLMVTGNFSWLNALSAVQAVATFSDGVLTSLLPVAAPTAAPTPVPLRAISVLVGLLVLGLSIRPARNMLSSSQVMNTSFDPFSLVNTYGAFGSITQDRYQLVVEGTHAEFPTDDDWTAYEFAGQPVRTDERPPQWAPYHLRLDWQLWFAAMRPRPGPRQRWVIRFLERLLEGDTATLSLLRRNPFSDDPPDRIRVLRYRYRFTTPEERAETGQWWVRERVGTYVHPVSLSDIHSRSRTAVRSPLAGN